MWWAQVGARKNYYLREVISLSIINSCHMCYSWQIIQSDVKIFFETRCGKVCLEVPQQVAFAKSWLGMIWWPITYL